MDYLQTGTTSDDEIKSMSSRPTTATSDMRIAWGSVSGEEILMPTSETKFTEEASRYHIDHRPKYRLPMLREDRRMSHRTSIAEETAAMLKYRFESVPLGKKKLDSLVAVDGRAHFVGDATEPLRLAAPLLTHTVTERSAESEEDDVFDGEPASSVKLKVRGSSKNKLQMSATRAVTEESRFDGLYESFGDGKELATLPELDEKACRNDDRVNLNRQGGNVDGAGDEIDVKPGVSRKGIKLEVKGNKRGVVSVARKVTVMRESMQDTLATAHIDATHLPLTNNSVESNSIVSTGNVGDDSGSNSDEERRSRNDGIVLKVKGKKRRSGLVMGVNETLESRVITESGYDAGSEKRDDTNVSDMEQECHSGAKARSVPQMLVDTPLVGQSTDSDSVRNVEVCGDDSDEDTMPLQGSHPNSDAGTRLQLKRRRKRGIAATGIINTHETQNITRESIQYELTEEQSTNREDFDGFDSRPNTSSSQSRVYLRLRRRRKGAVPKPVGIVMSRTDVNLTRISLDGGLRPTASAPKQLLPVSPTTRLPGSIGDSRNSVPKLLPAFNGIQKNSQSKLIRKPSVDILSYHEDEHSRSQSTLSWVSGTISRLFSRSGRRSVDTPKTANRKRVSKIPTAWDVAGGHDGDSDGDDEISTSRNDIFTPLPVIW